MAQCRTQLVPITLHRASAATLWKMLVKEFDNGGLVNAADMQTATMNPPCKMGDTANAVGKPAPEDNVVAASPSETTADPR